MGRDEDHTLLRTWRTPEGNTAPVGADDWYQFVLAPGCTATLTLTGSALVSYDVIMGEAAPPATLANSKLTGTHVYSAAASQKLTVRVWAPTIVTYTLMVVAK